MSIKAAMIKAIEKTGDGAAPVKFQDAFASNEAVAKMLLQFTTLTEVKEHKEKMLKDYPESMNEIAGSPAYIIALSAMLNEALIQFIRN